MAGQYFVIMEKQKVCSRLRQTGYVGPFNNQLASVIPALERMRLEDQEFKAILGYTEFQANKKLLFLLHTLQETSPASLSPPPLCRFSLGPSSAKFLSLS